MAARSCSRRITATRQGVVYDERRKRVVARRERRFRDLVLEAKAGSDDVPPGRGGARC